MYPLFHGPSENAVESCGWLAMKADVVTEDEEFVTLQRSLEVQGGGEHVAAGVQAGLVWTQTAAQVHLAGRQTNEISGLIVPASVFAHGSDNGPAAAAAAAAGAAAVVVFGAASFVAAQSQHYQTALLEQELEQALGRMCFAHLLHSLPQHWNHAADQAQALLLDSAALLLNRCQHWVVWPQLLRNTRA